ncbi:hypothetical protein IQ238_16840 [Pleurocapsales cyanobacterium LEGE 06147]|nr:hypothetical protein [Pleurocapsales cyanobacterium LEGE 06147]
MSDRASDARFSQAKKEIIIDPEKSDLYRTTEGCDRYFIKRKLELALGNRFEDARLLIDNL